MTSASSGPQSVWPALPLSAWQPTRDTLHLLTQIVGKVRLAPDPARVLLDFLQTTYEAAAESARWDRDALER